MKGSRQPASLPSGATHAGPRTAVHRHVGPGKLRVVQGCVGAVSCDQLVVVPTLNNPAVFHHRDQVGVADRGEAMGDDETGAVRAQRGHRMLHEQLGTSIHRAGRLVENQQRRVGEECPCDRDQLFLPGTDVASLVVDDGVVSLPPCVLPEPIGGPQTRPVLLSGECRMASPPGGTQRALFPSADQIFGYGSDMSNRRHRLGSLAASDTISCRRGQDRQTGRGGSQPASYCL